MGRVEGFLARWSRRKRLAATQPHETCDVAAPEKVPDATPVPPGQSGDVATVAPQSLPPIGSLGADSDVTPFLAPGVPVGLARQALRRAWITDPAIRDFVGLSENAWDFTVSDGVPGFGQLSAEDARRLAARALGPAEGSDVPTMPPADTAAPNEKAGAGRIAESRDFSRHHPHRSSQTTTDAGAQQEIGEAETNRPLPPRSHGRALPK